MELQYEQCPWNEPQVRSLYRNLPGMPIDSEWRDFPPRPGRVAVYRVYEERTFQAIYTDRASSLFKEMLLVPPPHTSDDSGWQIAKDRSGYYISSKFATTYDPQVNVVQFNEKLKQFSLSWSASPRRVERRSVFQAANH
jgi:hypothetical protein